MEEGFDRLRCPMCGGELVYSEGTHDLCCSRNPYESMSAEEWGVGAALRERRAGYGEGGGEGGPGRLYIYKVWGGGEEGGRLKQSAGGSASIDVRYPLTLHPFPHDSGEGIAATGEAGSGAQVPGGEGNPVNPSAARLKGPAEGPELYDNEAEASAEEYDRALTSDTPVRSHAARETAAPRGGLEGFAGGADRPHTPEALVKTHVKEMAVQNRVAEIYSGENEQVNPSDTHVKTHRCVFAVSFTESTRFGTLWSMRIVHAETNYFALTRLMQKIEKRLRSGEPLAANAPHPTKKREKSAAAKLAWRFGIEEEDVYSIRYSTETVKRLAIFYGITERDVKRIREADVEEDMEE